MSKIYVDEIQPKTSGGDISFGKLATIYPRGLTYYPAMLARKTTTYSSSSGAGYWVCNSEEFDEGSNYDTSTGKFTAPIDGIYHVDFFLLGQSGDNFDLVLRKNGSQYLDYDIRNNSSAIGGNFTLSFSGVIKMDANDTCGIYVNSISNDIYGTGLNQLSIYLVTPV
jgi:hypothetical protein